MIKYLFFKRSFSIDLKLNHFACQRVSFMSTMKHSLLTEMYAIYLFHATLLLFPSSMCKLIIYMHTTQ